MKLTREIIHSAGEGRFQSGFNYHQLQLLGVNWPPRGGWLRELVGQEIPDETWDLVMRLKGKPKAVRRQILELEKIDQIKKRNHLVEIVMNFSAESPCP